MKRIKLYDETFDAFDQMDEEDSRKEAERIMDFDVFDEVSFFELPEREDFDEEGEL